MDYKEFKEKFRPAACRRAPWARLIPKEIRGKVMAKIRQEANQFYGQNYDECPKRHVCFGKKCIGRPLPWKSVTAQPYLEKLKKLYVIKDGELYLSNCESCAIKNVCSSPCAQVNDFLNRERKEELKMSFKDNLNNISGKVNNEKIIHLPFLENKKIPWDCISEKKRRIVRKYLYERKDFLTIAKEEGLNNQSKAKYVYYSALTKLSEYAIMRNFLDNKSNLLTISQKILLDKVYFDNMSLAKAAKELNITRQAAQQRLKRVKNKFKIKFFKFVRKKKVNGKIKIIYYIPEVLR